MGRRTKLLDPHVRETILEYIRKGNYIKTACLAAGVDEDTYYEWQRRGEAGGGNGNEVYTEFLVDLKKARAANVAYNVDIIQTAGPKNWCAAAWLLERMEPSEYGKRMELDIGPSKVLLALQESARRTIGTVEVKELTSGEGV